MKLYSGPYKSKVEDIQVLAPYPVNSTDTSVSETGAITVAHVLGMNPGHQTHFSSLYAPDFKRLVRDGWVIQCPYEKTEEEWEYTPGHYQDQTYFGNPVKNAYTTYTNVVRGFQTRSAFPTLSESQSFLALDRAHDEVLTKVFAKAAAPLVDSLVDLSQIGETLRMFLTLARRLLVMIKSPGAFFRWVKTNSVDVFTTARIPGNPHGRLSELSGLWCELRFGWRPLLVSIDGLAQTLAEGDDELSRRVTYRSQEDVSLSSTASNVYYSNIMGWSLPVEYKTTHTITASVRGGILLEQQRTTLAKAGFEWENVPFAAWDLVPFSFIMDRFLTIGNYLRSLRPIPNAAFGGAWVVTRYTSRTQYDCTRTPGGFSSGSGASYKAWTRTSVPDRVTCIRRGVVRTIHRHHPPFPTLKWDWAQITDLYNAIDGLMLLIQEAHKTVRR